MKRREGSGKAQPLTTLELVLCRGPAHHWDDRQPERITAERWRQHGLPAMAKWDAERADYLSSPPPWPWLLWGDPVGYTSPGDTRWLAVLDELSACEAAAAHGWDDPAGWVAELRRVAA